MIGLRRIFPLHYDIWLESNAGANPARAAAQRDAPGEGKSDPHMAGLEYCLEIPLNTNGPHPKIGEALIPFPSIIMDRLRRAVAAGDQAVLFRMVTE